MDAAPDEEGDGPVVPLATPLVAGPGAISHRDRALAPAPLVAVVAGTPAALLALGASRLVTERLARVLSPARLQFVTRVFGQARRQPRP